MADTVPEVNMAEVEKKTVDERTLKDSDSDQVNEKSSSDAKAPARPEDKTEKEEQKGSLKDFFRIFKYADKFSWFLYAVAAVSAVVTGASLPLFTLIFGSSTSTFDDYATNQGNGAEFTSSVDHLVLYFVYLFVGRFVINYVGTLCVCVAASRTTNSLRKAFLDSLLRQEIAHFDEQGRGSAATQVTTNGNRVNQGIAEKLYTFVLGLGLFFSAYIVALAVQWKLALITMSIIPAIFGVIGVCVAIDAPIEARIVLIYSRAANLAQDIFGSIKTIHAFGAQEKTVKWYDEYLEEARKEGKKKSIIYGIIFSTQSFFVMCAIALAFWEGYRLFADGEIDSVGTVFTVVLSVTLGATSIIYLLPQFQSFTNASSAAAELFASIDKPSKLDPLATDGLRPETCEGDIEIRDLCFAYPSRSSVQVLKGLNMSIPAGKTTALVGASGSGKSTLVGLLERWYEPTSGRIILDGHDLADYNTKWLRNSIKLVQQEPTLFRGTVFENVAKGLVGEQQNLPREEQMRMIKEACISANAHDFIDALPEGYDTQLGERAGMLSGGQRQRVSIARSIVSDPKILLFDEATSALDPRAERVVQDALNKVSANKTTLIIAHKLATVMLADNICVMLNGKVHEQGSHNELLKRDGLYASMVRAQDLGDVDDDEVQEKRSQGSELDETDEKRADMTLQRTQSEAASAAIDSQVKHLTAGTLNYSLAKCIFLLLKERPDLYLYYGVTFVGCLIAGGTYPAQAILFSHLIEVFTLTGAEAQSSANFYSLLFFVLALANLLAYFTIGIACNVIGQTLTFHHRREMFQRTVNFDQDFFDRTENSSGTLTAKLSSVPSALQELMSGNLGLMLNVLVNLLSSSILGIAFGWKLGLVMVFAGLVLIVAGGYIRVRLDQKLEAWSDEQFANSASLAAEAVSSIRTVSSLTLERSILNEYEATLDSILKKVTRNLIFALLPYAFSQSVDFLVLALGFWYGSQLIVSGEYTVTQFFVIFIATVFGGQGAAQFFAYTSSITKASGSANYLLWLRTVKPEIRETEENKDHGPSGDDVAIGVENVDFRYKQRHTAKVLRGISMKINPGQYCAFVGPSGCGKSTIVSLLERFYDPTSGRITMNSEDISQMSPNLYRRYMSLVQQEPPLYIGSVRDNITIGLNHEASDKEVDEACQQANVSEFVSSLPEGLNTQCGSRGLQFSGGQRQRVAVARALIRKPRLLLLDEATSALDTQSERIVQKALDEAASKRTTIAVAHRLSTIRHADVIFVIEDGKIAESGTHEELQKLKGRYFSMCLAQSLDQN